MNKCKGKGRKGGRVVAVILMILTLAGCSAKLTTGQNMGFQARTLYDTLIGVENMATAAFATTPDQARKDWIYHNVFPAIDRAALAIQAYIKAAQDAIKLEKAGGKVANPEYLLKEAAALVGLVEAMWKGSPK